jgi:hypothetical protein
LIARPTRISPPKMVIIEGCNARLLVVKVHPFREDPT